MALLNIRLSLGHRTQLPPWEPWLTLKFPQTLLLVIRFSLMAWVAWSWQETQVWMIVKVAILASAGTSRLIRSFKWRHRCPANPHSKHTQSSPTPSIYLQIQQAPARQECKQRSWIAAQIASRTAAPTTKKIASTSIWAPISFSSSHRGTQRVSQWQEISSSSSRFSIHLSR